MTEQLREIGMRLAALRDIFDISTKDMAEKLGISEEEYIAYENGKNDFSFSFLYNAAQIFNVDVLDIMSGDSPTLSTCCVVKAGHGYEVTRNKAYDYRHLAYTFRAKKAEPFLVTVEPGDKTPTLHGHDGQEFNYMISGKMMFFIGDISYELEPGDSVYFDSSVPHAEKAIGNEPASFIAVVIK